MKNQKTLRAAIPLSFQAARFWETTLLFLLAAAPLLQAQLPVARLQGIFPPGGRAGSSFEVSIRGSDLDEASQLLFSSTNLTALVKTNADGKRIHDKFSFAIHSNTAPGFYEVRAVSRFGISNPRLFAVDTRPEISAPATNTSAEGAFEVPQGAWLNGRVEPAAYAYFRFNAERGQRLLIECLDGQIDSRLDASLILYDDKQREVARNRRGGLLDYTAPATGTFTLRLNDFLFRGGADYFYRLLISTRPHIDFVFPPAALPNTTNKHQLYGRNLPGGVLSSKTSADGKKLEKLSVDIAMPAQPPASLAGRSLGMNVPAAVVDSIEYRFSSSNGFSNPVLLSAATAPVMVERHTSKTSLQSLSVPCEVAGQFYPADDRDWYVFEAKKGDVYWLEVFSQRLGAPSDPLVVVQRVSKNDKGQEQVTEIKELNDSDANFGGAEYKTSSLDPAWRFAVPETGTYRVQVRDLFSRFKADPRLVYRLSIRRESPDFRLVATPAAHSPPKKDSKEVTLWSPALRKGQTLPCRVLVFRRDNFSGDIVLNVEGLPPFLTCPPVTVPPGSNSATLLFTAATNATDWAGPIRITGEGKAGDKTLLRDAVGASLTWTIADNSIEPTESRLTQQIALSVCAAESAPVRLFAAEGKTFEAAANAKVKIPLSISRAADWPAALKLKPSGAPALASLKELDVDAKTSSASLEIDLAKQKLTPGTYTFYLQSEAQGKYRASEKAKPKDTTIYVYSAPIQLKVVEKPGK